MKKIDYNIKLDNYSNQGMIGKTIYMKRNLGDINYHYIFNIKDIINQHPAVYMTDKQYILEIPKNGLCKVYDNSVDIKLNYNDILYELDRFEYIDLFRCFVKNEGVKSNTIEKGLLL